MSDLLVFVDYGETFVFVVLLLASILALAVGMERAVVFKRNSGKKIHQFAQDLIALLRKRDYRAVAGLVKESPDNCYTRFAAFSLELAEDSHEGLPDLMAGKIIEERIFLEKRLTVLNTLGNNAPFIGLLGTVLGVIKAFHGLGTLGSTGADVVMRSISKALLATAAGLFIAIPVVMANNYFSKKVKIILQQLEILSKEIGAGMRGPAKKPAAKKTVKTKKPAVESAE
ncbi:MAG TPA: MotA/TolQ/ExbB proton channel family protein [Spirochaetota bacterium]|nr:MotA/TolQ/ExbB proton channel family protein [Spirochaetota bacterium]HRZ28731.1 MotA/TolQ/ExbB proton channel family protein [Spirochaetota bacterium]HSA15035.1 MotA/TolQ/ExbB proton channel family protein [Spirochaetota bacterium]